MHKDNVELKAQCNSYKGEIGTWKAKYEAL